MYQLDCSLNILVLFLKRRAIDLFGAALIFDLNDWSSVKTLALHGAFSIYTIIHSIQSITLSTSFYLISSRCEVQKHHFERCLLRRNKNRDDFVVCVGTS